MRKNNLNTKIKPDLFGIDAICEFAEKSPATLISWEKHYNFPMWKENAVYVSFKDKIVGWYDERGCNPKTVNEELLSSYRIKQWRENSIRAAKELNWERESEKLKEIYEQIAR